MKTLAHIASPVKVEHLTATDTIFKCGEWYIDAVKTTQNKITVRMGRHALFIKDGWTLDTTKETHTISSFPDETAKLVNKRMKK